MSWKHRQEELEKILNPDLAQFVNRTLDKLAAENVCDAPSLIGGVVQRLRTVDNPVLRNAIPAVEMALAIAFSRRPAVRL